MLRKAKELCGQYSALTVMAVYAVVYMALFYYLENRQIAYHVIHFGIDAYIPFCKYFVVQYVMWFGYVAITVCWLCITDKEEGRQLVSFLIAGMTIFLFISAVFPNGLNLRPKRLEGDDIFIRMIKALYAADTSTNVIPSIHVYNSIAIMVAVWRTGLLKKHWVIKCSMLILGVLIICSTVLIKQHSMLDVTVAFILSGLAYTVFYRNNEITEPAGAEAKYKY